MSAFGHQVIDTAATFFVTGIPVLDGGVFHFSIFVDYNLYNGGM